MTLTSHAVVGAVVASLMPQHPILGFCAAFASHFIIDAIPHRDYPISSSSVNPNIGTSMKYDKALFFDMLRIGTDILVGISLSLWILLPTQNVAVILLGAVAGILPDPLQFVYAHFRHEPFVSLQRFHRWMHSKNHMKTTPIFGVVSQLLFLVAVAVAARLLL